VPYGLWSDHVLGWWKHKDEPNVLFPKYEDLKKVNIFADNVPFYPKLFIVNIVFIVTSEAYNPGVISFWLHLQVEYPSLKTWGGF